MEGMLDVKKKFLYFHLRHDVTESREINLMTMEKDMSLPDDNLTTEHFFEWTKTAIRSFTTTVL